MKMFLEAENRVNGMEAENRVKEPHVGWTEGIIRRLGLLERPPNYQYMTL
jgi:hypothetical protein